jgi:hypothetical protein
MLLSDQGKKFYNDLMDNLCKLMGIQKSRTTPYHPQCNSQVEVVNKHVAKYLGDCVSSDTLDWEALIPAMAFAYNTTMQRTTMNTPFFPMYGLDYRTPYFSSTPDYSENFASNLSGRMKIAREVANKHMEKNSQTYAKDYNKKAILHLYKEGDLVLLRIDNVKNKNKQDRYRPVSRLL